VVGSGARHELAPTLALTAPDARACVLVTQQALVDAGWLEGLDSGLEQSVIVIPEGEDQKSLATIELLCRQLVERGISRRDVLVAVGGGLVSDVTGFAAAIYHRGIGYLTVATTLLAQVDAAIGGKTGVNLLEGKNLVGAFWQPLGVLCDLEVLSTLPPAELACGRGEMAKYAFLGGSEPTAEMLSWPLGEQVARCAEIKAAIVAVDEREGGLRMVLNYGHTLAHALEALGLERRSTGAGGRVAELRHGEAVAVGIAFAALLARRLGRIDDARVELHREILRGFDLDARLPEGLGAAALVDAMRRDKKAHHDLTFVLDGPRGLEPVAGIDPDLVVATLSEMGASR
jgi:5-deoxy-5-amino-3-dehydroquinate synthase